MSIHLYEVVQNIIGVLKNHQAPIGSNVDIWEKILSQIRERDSFNASYCDVIQDVISDYLKKLDDDSKRYIWKETETGCKDNDSDVQDIYIDSISMDLEQELLDEITRYAWDEANQ